MQQELDSELVLKHRAYTKPWVASALGVSERHIQRLMAAGRIRSVRIGRSVRIPGAEVLRILKGGVTF
ncbi:MAG: helix-turn-helix domain-containing protein [Armatimonadetes bacterium]|nr:helix-turn-helix domain-containing protein [Armatimonadota bacterium]